MPPKSSFKYSSDKDNRSLIRGVKMPLCFFTSLNSHFHYLCGTISYLSTHNIRILNAKKERKIKCTRWYYTVLSFADFSQMSQGTQLLPMYWLFLHFIENIAMAREIVNKINSFYLVFLNLPNVHPDLWFWLNIMLCRVFEKNVAIYFLKFKEQHGFTLK